MITMTTKAPEDEVCQSVLDFVAEGAYPESEKVVASDLPVSALSKELVLISKAREQVEVSVLLLDSAIALPHTKDCDIGRNKHAESRK